MLNKSPSSSASSVRFPKIKLSWLPATDLDDASVKEPIATPLTTTEYIVTADKDGCIVKGRVNML